MRIREYISVILHPKRTLAQLEAARANLEKWRYYAGILESKLGIEPRAKVLITEAKAPLIVLGDEARVNCCVFYSDQMVIIHPEAKRVMFTFCHFFNYPSGDQLIKFPGGINGNG